MTKVGHRPVNIEEGGTASGGIQLDALTSCITDRIMSDRSRLSEGFVAQEDLDQTMREQASRITGFKDELLSTQDMHLATLHKDLERQQEMMDKIRAEIRHEIDKLTASQRLDLNLEKGRTRDELQQMQNKSADLEIRLEREMSMIKTMLERARNDIAQNIVAIVGMFSAVAFTISRLVTM